MNSSIVSPLNSLDSEYFLYGHSFQIRTFFWTKGRIFVLPEIIHNNSSISWIDVDPITGNITPDTLKSAIARELIHEYPLQSQAVSIVHWGGNPCDVEEIAQICKEHNLKLIEDGAHSLGMEYNGKPFGYYSDFAMHSFQLYLYPNP